MISNRVAGQDEFKSEIRGSGPTNTGEIKENQITTCT